MIKEIVPDKRRISLSLRDVEGDPWLDVDKKYARDQAVDGIVEKVEKFGVFVRLAPGIVGLLPKSVISQSGGVGRMENLKAGQTIAVAVDSVNTAERKISLKLRDTGDDNEWRNFAQESGSDTALGTLADKLNQALKEKKDET